MKFSCIIRTTKFPGRISTLKIPALSKLPTILPKFCLLCGASMKGWSFDPTNQYKPVQPTL